MHNCLINVRGKYKRQQGRPGDETDSTNSEFDMKDMTLINNMLTHLNPINYPRANIL